jgi:hypothetical protein
MDARKQRERGQVLVLFAGGIVVLLTIAALAFDVGMMLLERRDEQNAADAAALAGARYVFEPDCVAPAWTCTEARAKALAVALENGYDDADPNESVDINIPAEQGRYDGLPNFIEVQITAERPSIFGGVIGRAEWPISVFAVATNDQEVVFPFSMLALDWTACKAIQVSGGGLVEAYGNIQANSDGSDCPEGADNIAFSRTGDSTIDVIADDATCRAAGEIQDQGAGEMTCTTAPNSWALPDPLQGLDAPVMPDLADPMLYVGPGAFADNPGDDNYPRDCPGDTDRPPSETSPVTCKLAQTGQWDGKSWVLYPGLYPGGLEISADTTAYLMPGIYWIGGGGIRVANGGTIFSIATESDADVDPALATWGGGVLIYNSSLPVAGGAGGPINFDGSSAGLKLKMFCAEEAAGQPDAGCAPLREKDDPLYNPDQIYNTLSIFQDRTLAAAITLNGSASGAEVEGVIYAAEGIVTLNGNGGTLIVDQVIANQFNVMGNEGTIQVLKRVGFDAIIEAAGLVD